MYPKFTPKLFAVYLGGRAPKAKIELHDIVFVAGNAIEDTYEQLLDKWFGTPVGLHLDSWMQLDIADGYKITLTDRPPAATGKKLFFLNVGAYAKGKFTELHGTVFIVADDIRQAKTRGKAALAGGFSTQIHTDDLYDIDDCLELATIGPYHVQLDKTDAPENFQPTNGYHLVPKGLVEDYLRRKA